MVSSSFARSFEIVFELMSVWSCQRRAPRRRPVSRPAAIPKGVKITVSDRLTVEGPKGKQSVPIPAGITFKQTDGILELVRDGSKQTVHSRWRQDKGHRTEWTTFARSIQQQGASPIGFEEIVCSTLATLRIDESLATGKSLPVDSAAFIDAAQRISSENPN